MQYDPIQGQGH